MFKIFNLVHIIELLSNIAIVIQINLVSILLDLVCIWHAKRCVSVSGYELKLRRSSMICFNLSAS